MQPGSDLTFTEQINAAAARGQMVLISPLSQPPLAAVPPRDEGRLAIALSLLFGLRRSEAMVLATLLTSEFIGNDTVVPPRISPSRERALDTIGRDPAKPTKLIARELGISPTTARKARREGTADKRCGEGSLTVYVHAMRRKLKAHRIEIVTLWGCGYGLTEESLRIIHRRLAAHDAKITRAKPQTTEQHECTETN
jgi:hypothetical protein